jgi:hypothetical protein
VQDAEQPAFDDERDAEERADLLLVQERVDGITRFEIADDDRLAPGRDAAGEALANGKPEPGLDLLLETAGRPRHEFVRVLVEKQDCGGVALENVNDPDKKRLEKAVELEVRESRLGDPLKVAGEIVRGLGAGGAQRLRMVRELSLRSITAVMTTRPESRLQLSKQA